jgi:transposase
VHDILEFRRQGLSVSAIRALTGFDRKTIRKYLAEQPAVPTYGPRKRRPRKLDPFVPYIEERLAAGVWNAVVLLRELRERGYRGGYSILTEYLHPKRKAAQEVAVRRFETPLGHQAQVDWGDLGALQYPDGSKQRLSGFVFTLGHSRALFADAALDQSLPTLLAMHEAAFLTLGGVPAEILYDRMKTVALGVDERGEVHWQPTFLDFARYWGFVPRLCRAYRPQTKGKVESGVKYLRRNFLCGRTASSVEELREQLRAWTWEVANQRVHGTTHQGVAEAWRVERLHLQPTAGRPAFPYAPQVVRRVSRDAYVAYGANRYSVPWTLAGLEVSLRQVGDRLEVYREGARLATHSLSGGRHQVITVPAHHRGIPTVSTMRHEPGRISIVLQEMAPQVEVRPLSAYEALAEMGALS